MHIFDFFNDHHGKLFDISTDTRKLVAKRSTKSKKEKQ